VIPSPTFPPTWTPVIPPTSQPPSTPDPTPISGFYPPTPQPPPTPTRPITPLSFEFWINGARCEGSGYIANVTIRPQGGNGVYTYYHDINQIAGPVEGEILYDLEWLSCGGAPGTFYVRSAGQEVSKEFWIQRPDCCSP
jgi:hypothetical protein